MFCGETESLVAMEFLRWMSLRANACFTRRSRIVLSIRAHVLVESLLQFGSQWELQASSALQWGQQRGGGEEGVASTEKKEFGGIA